MMDDVGIDLSLGSVQGLGFLASQYQFDRRFHTDPSSAIKLLKVISIPRVGGLCRY